MYVVLGASVISTWSKPAKTTVMFRDFYAPSKKTNDDDNHLVKLIIEEKFDNKGDTIKSAYKIVGFKEISPEADKTHPKFRATLLANW